MAKDGYIVVIQAVYDYGLISDSLLRVIKRVAIKDPKLSFDAYTEILELMHFLFRNRVGGIILCRVEN